MIKDESQKLNKMAGALIGAAVGDALGWPNEQNSKNIYKDRPKENAELFHKWIRRDGYKYWSHDEEIYPGEYSDDTQLIIATARSLRYGSNWIKYFTKVELPAWLSYERGGGGATKKAAEAWKRGNKPWNLDFEKKVDVEKYFNAGGNGVAMRILPHVLGAECNREKIMRQILSNGITTHGHPGALIGALLYAHALIYLLNMDKTLGYGELVDLLIAEKDKWSAFPNVQKVEDWLNTANIIYKDSYMNIWNDTVKGTTDLLNIVKKGLEEGALDMGVKVLEKIGCFDKKINGLGTVTAVAAIYLVSKYASGPQLALTEAAYLKNSDTDTLASMVGGLIGMLYGTEVFSTWFNVQDYEFIKGLIYDKPMLEDTVKTSIFDYYNKAMKAKLKRMKPGEHLITKPFGKLTLTDKRLNKSNMKGRLINTLKFVSEEGQSIFVKTYEKEPEEKITALQEKPPNQKPEDEQIPKRQTTKIQVPAPDCRKLKKLAVLFSDKPEVNLCLQFIADIIEEMERTGTGKIDAQGYVNITEKWMKHNYDKKIIDVAIEIITNH